MSYACILCYHQHKHRIIIFLWCLQWLLCDFIMNYRLELEYSPSSRTNCFSCNHFRVERKKQNGTAEKKRKFVLWLCLFSMQNGITIKIHLFSFYALWIAFAIEAGICQRPMLHYQLLINMHLWRQSWCLTSTYYEKPTLTFQRFAAMLHFTSLHCSFSRRDCLNDCIDTQFIYNMSHIN